MTLITETLSLPGGVTPTSALVEIRLVGNGGGVPIEGFASGVSIVSAHLVRLTASEHGAWSLDLHDNSSITPTGTRWRRIVTVPASGGRVVADDYLLVPASGSSYRVDQVLSSPPGVVLDPDTASTLSNRVAVLETTGGGSVAGSSYRHVQSTPAATWTVTHNLGYFPNVTAFSSAGDELHGRIVHVDGNHLTITLYVGGVPVAFSGEAYCT